ncbi:MAG: flagellar hook-associated protein FlgK [Xanthobacteraceae bacterium]|nr:flagellar hook-associated protein FlgK [Xanthobacteraceae bacterium]
MSLTQALATAVSGLRVNQAGMSLVAANVANADTPGYVKKTAVQITTAAGSLGVGVRVAAVNRELDQYVQRQLRVETSGAAYATLRSQFYDRMQTVYGVPGSDSALETLYNSFTTSLQALTTSPDSESTRTAVISAAQVLTQQLGSMSNDIQALRSDAELGLSDSVTKANEAMLRIAAINQQLGASGASDGTTAVLQDQRDAYIDQLTNLMDIRVVPTDNNQVNVFTTSGIQLVGTRASHLEFDAQGTMTPSAEWTDDPATRTVGTITLSASSGGTVDLIASKAFRSGKIASYIEMRDELLPQAQAQLDAVAGALARSLSDKNVASTAAPASVLPQAGFDLDVSGLLAGNTINLNYTTSTGQTHKMSLIRVDQAGALPLSNDVTPDPTDEVIGIDFSAGMASVLSQLNTAFGASGMQFTNPAGNTLRALDDGASNLVNINSLSATVTETSLTGGTPALPFFTDANASFSGAITSAGKQITGLAGRLTINEALLADPSRLVVYQTSPLTDAGDATRPNFIYNRLTKDALSFSPETGIGTKSVPFGGSLPSFMRQVISQQGDASEAAGNLKAGQDVVLTSLQQRFNDGASVNVDEEMAHLLNLQTAYAANARVLTTIRDMLDTLMRM